MIFDLVKDFADVLESMPDRHPRRRILELLDEAVRRDVHFIDRHPTTLFQCMWNTCWWYDCDEAARHYQSGEERRSMPRGVFNRRMATDGTFLETPRDRSDAHSTSRQASASRLCDVIEHWRRHRPARPPWLRSLRPPPVRLGGQLKTILQGHQDTAMQAAYSPDGRRIVSGGLDNTIRVWDVASGELLACFNGHTKPVRCVVFSPDGHRVASGSDDHTVRLWDVSSGSEVACFPGHEAKVSCVACSPDGKSICSCSEDGSVRIWDVGGQSVSACLTGHGRCYRCVSFSPDGRRIAVGSSSTVFLFDASSGAQLLRLEGHVREVTCLSFSPSSDKLVTGSEDASVILWDADNGALLARLTGHRNKIACAAFSSSAQQVMSLGGDTCLKTWDVSTGLELSTARPFERSIHSAVLSPNLQEVATCGVRRSIHVWDTSGDSDVVRPGGHEAAITGLAFTPDGSQLVTGSDDASVRVWDPERGIEVARRAGHNDEVSCIDASRDGARTVSASKDGTIIVWDLRTGRALTRIVQSEIVDRVGLSPNGKWVCAFVFDGLRMWDAKNTKELGFGAGRDLWSRSGLLHDSFFRAVHGLRDFLRRLTDIDHLKAKLKKLRDWDVQLVVEQCIHRLAQWLRRGRGSEEIAPTKTRFEALLDRDRQERSRRRLTSVVFSAEGERMATAFCKGRRHDPDAEIRLRVWDARTGAKLARLVGHREWVSALAFSPDGQTIASVSDDRTVRVWDASSGAELACLVGHEKPISCVAFSMVGEQIVSGSADKTVRVWDVPNNTEAACLGGHEDGVSTVAFSPDGTRVASGSHDKRIRVWDAATGVELLSLTGHEQWISRVVFSADGSRIISAQGGTLANTFDGCVRIWDARTGECQEEIVGISDVQAVCEEQPLTAYGFTARSNETIICSRARAPVAFFPVELSLATLRPHPRGRRWAGSATTSAAGRHWMSRTDSHLCLFVLEDETAELYAP